jgi:hypothetical protein
MCNVQIFFKEREKGRERERERERYGELRNESKTTLLYSLLFIY